MRTPEFLITLAREFPTICDRLIKSRPLLQPACSGHIDQLADELYAEMNAEGAADRDYWIPLKQELEELRRIKRRSRYGDFLKLTPFRDSCGRGPMESICR